jgi:molybdopterin-guanine dinucleotide biosynthesis protein A
MGTSKASVQLAGHPLIRMPLDAMRAAGLERVVVAKAGTELPVLDVPVWVEPEEPSHPLTGIVAALERGRRPVVVCGCDLPFVGAELLAALAADSRPLVVVEAGGRLHPLLGRYDYDMTLVDSLRAARDAQRSLHEVVAELRGARMAAPDEVVFNVNTPADLARAEEMVRNP